MAEYERPMQERLERLQSADDTNDVDRRHGNKRVVRDLRSRLDLWLPLLDELTRSGPSGLQLAVILDDLAPYWDAIRQRARRQTPYAD